MVKGRVETRQAMVDLFNSHGLDEAAKLYGTTRDSLIIYGDYLGCQNIVYDYTFDGLNHILRVSHRPDRSFEQIAAEVHFVSYLADNGARVSRPVLSTSGNLVETLQIRGHPFHIVSFLKGRGTRVPDNGYRYREGVPLEVYFRDWGQTLGRIHALAKRYEPLEPSCRRPDWLSQRGLDHIEGRVPNGFPVVRRRLKDLVAEAGALPRELDSYGLIHADFNDGNFTLDYDTGDITVFDFDDCCYGWFMYDLACAWEGGVGRTMFEMDVKRRRAFMERYFELVMEGYEMENHISDAWLNRLPIFLKLVEMESILTYFQYYKDGNLDSEGHGMLDYLVYCVENDVPYLGFFDAIFSPENPFSL